MQMILDNFQFLLMCFAIIAILGFGSRMVERFLPEKRTVTPARRVSIIGICAAIATVLHMLDFPVLFIAPGFYKLDFSELPVLLCGFYLGPSATVACEGIKILLKLMLKSTSTAFVGDLANFVVGCSFVLPATIWYHAHKSKHSAIIGLVLGTLSMSIFGSAFNAVYLLPKFADLYGMPLDTIIAMGTAIRGGDQLCQLRPVPCCLSHRRSDHPSQHDRGLAGSGRQEHPCGCSDRSRCPCGSWRGLRPAQGRELHGQDRRCPAPYGLRRSL